MDAFGSFVGWIMDKVFAVVFFFTGLFRSKK